MGEKRRRQTGKASIYAIIYILDKYNNICNNIYSRSIRSDISRQYMSLLKLLNDKEEDEKQTRKVFKHIIYILDQ